MFYNLGTWAVLTDDLMPMGSVISVYQVAMKSLYLKKCFACSRSRPFTEGC